MQRAGVPGCAALLAFTSEEAPGPGSLFATPSGSPNDVVKFWRKRGFSGGRGRHSVPLARTFTFVTQGAKRKGGGERLVDFFDSKH